MRSPAIFVVSLCVFGVLASAGRNALPAQASASVVLASGFSETRTTIPVTIQGVRTTCVLDTGSSAMLVSPRLAREAGLTSEGGTFEVAPDGHTYADRQTQIGRFAVAGLRDARRAGADLREPQRLRARSAATISSRAFRR